MSISKFNNTKDRRERVVTNATIAITNVLINAFSAEPKKNNDAALADAIVTQIHSIVDRAIIMAGKSHGDAKTARKTIRQAKGGAK